MTQAIRTAAVARGTNLEYLTVAWNSLEGIIALALGVLAGSIALIGFGFDSIIEGSSGLVLLWRLHRDSDAARREQIEAHTLKLVGISFVVLAAYVAYDALASFLEKKPPEASYSGTVLAILSLIVMPVLARAKRRVATVITSRALQADARQTDICAYLSGILLAGLALNLSIANY
jgi:divalent metal cation (Fe/Co/Zn/Cd) transporter